MNKASTNMFSVLSTFDTDESGSESENEEIVTESTNNITKSTKNITQNSSADKLEDNSHSYNESDDEWSVVESRQNPKKENTYNKFSRHENNNNVKHISKSNIENISIEEKTNDV